MLLDITDSVCIFTHTHVHRRITIRNVDISLILQHFSTFPFFHSKKISIVCKNLSETFSWAFKMKCGPHCTPFRLHFPLKRGAIASKFSPLNKTNTLIKLHIITRWSLNSTIFISIFETNIANKAFSFVNTNFDYRLLIYIS